MSVFQQPKIVPPDATRLSDVSAGWIVVKRFFDSPVITSCLGEAEDDR